MLASDFIDDIQNMIDKYGECEIVLEGDDGNRYIPDSVGFEEYSEDERGVSTGGRVIALMIPDPEGQQL